MLNNLDFVLSDLEAYLQFMKAESGNAPDLALACDFLEMQEIPCDSCTVSMASEIVQSIIGADFQ